MSELAVVLLLPITAWSEVLYSINRPTQELVEINTYDGATTPILALGGPVGDTDLALSSDGHYLYVLRSVLDVSIEIITVDLSVPTIIATHPVTLNGETPNQGVQILAEGLAMVNGRLVIGFELRPPNGGYYPDNYFQLSNTIAYLDPTTGAIDASGPMTDLFSLATQPCPEDIAGSDLFCRADLDGMTALPNGHLLVVDQIHDGRFNTSERTVQFFDLTWPNTPSYTLLPDNGIRSPGSFSINDVALSCDPGKFYAVNEGPSGTGSIFKFSFADPTAIKLTVPGPYSQWSGLALKPNPTGACVHGPDIVCSGSTGNQYSVTGLPDGTTYLWTTNGNGRIVGPDNGSSVVVEAGIVGTGSNSSFGIHLSINGGSEVAQEQIPLTPFFVVSPTARCSSEFPTSLSVSIYGAKEPIAYSWSGPGGFNSTQSSITGLTAPGTYTVTVTDASGCSASASARLGPTVSVNSETICASEGPATLTATPAGGSGEFTYLWSPGGQTSPSIQVSVDGTYTVTVTDANGCVASGSGKLTIVGGTGTGSVVGAVTANCPTTGTGLLGVTVDAFMTGSGTLAGSAVTDATGHYVISPLAPGGYVITVVTPLGYSIASPETNATVGCEAGAANFALTCGRAGEGPRTIGYWKHQVGVATGGKGTAQVSGPALCSELDLIAAHFNGNSLNQVVVYQPPSSGVCADKLQSAKTLLNLPGSVAMIDRARQQLMALLLNVAAGYIRLTDVISADGATVSQAITYCDNIIDNPSGNYERAKTIADDINNGVVVPAGFIPLNTAQIAYRKGAGKLSFRVTPNPGHGTQTFLFTLGKQGPVHLGVYDLSGRLVAQLLKGPMDAGAHKVPWNGTSDGGGRVGNGLYFVRLNTQEGSRSLKVLELRP